MQFPMVVTAPLNKATLEHDGEVDDVEDVLTESQGLSLRLENVGDLIPKILYDRGECSLFAPPCIPMCRVTLAAWYMYEMYEMYEYSVFPVRIPLCNKVQRRHSVVQAEISEWCAVRVVV
jgi:hypothetical protein